jgi:two-component sensor histidine kinase
MLSELLDHADEDRKRVVLSGPDVRLSPRTAGPFALCIHELATNAWKHGALMRDDGTIHVRWQGADRGPLIFEWRERKAAGAPPPRPERTGSPGAGLRLVRGLVEHDLAGSVSFGFDDRGFRCTIELPSAAECERASDGGRVDAHATASGAAR